MTEGRALPRERLEVHGGAGVVVQALHDHGPVERAEDGVLGGVLRNEAAHGGAVREAAGQLDPYDDRLEVFVAQGLVRLEPLAEPRFQVRVQAILVGRVLLLQGELEALPADRGEGHLPGSDGARRGDLHPPGAAGASLGGLEPHEGTEVAERPLHLREGAGLMDVAQEAGVQGQVLEPAAGDGGVAARSRIEVPVQHAQHPRVGPASAERLVEARGVQGRVRVVGGLEGPGEQVHRRAVILQRAQLPRGVRAEELDALHPADQPREHLGVVVPRHREHRDPPLAQRPHVPLQVPVGLEAVVLLIHEVPREHHRPGRVRARMLDDPVEGDRRRELPGPQPVVPEDLVQPGRPPPEVDVPHEQDLPPLPLGVGAPDRGSRGAGHGAGAST